KLCLKGCNLRCGLVDLTGQSLQRVFLLVGKLAGGLTLRLGGAAGFRRTLFLLTGLPALKLLTFALSKHVRIAAGIFKPDAVAFGCDGAGDSPIEEITIVADQDYGCWEIFHQFLQEIERLHVEVVGGLVENEQVCGAGEQSGEDESGLLATRKF